MRRNGIFQSGWFIALSIIVILIFGAAQTVVGFWGLDYLWGKWAAIVGALVLFWMRFSLPITVGSYFGATEVLGWPWYAGAIFAAPGLLFVIPGVVAVVWGWISGLTAGRRL